MDQETETLLHALEAEERRLRAVEEKYEAEANQAKQWARRVRMRRLAIQDKVDAVRQGQLSFDAYIAGREPDVGHH
jgi:hypothetical protein